MRAYLCAQAHSRDAVSTVRLKTEKGAWVKQKCLHTDLSLYVLVLLPSYTYILYL